MANSMDALFARLAALDMQGRRQESLDSDENELDSEEPLSSDEDPGGEAFQTTWPPAHMRPPAPEFSNANVMFTPDGLMMMTCDASCGYENGMDISVGPDGINVRPSQSKLCGGKR